MASDMNRIVKEDQVFFDQAEKNIVEADENVSHGASELQLVRYNITLSGPNSLHLIKRFIY